MATKNSTKVKNSFNDVVSAAEKKLNDRKNDWQKAYHKYATEINDKIKAYTEKGKILSKMKNFPEDVRIYSSITLVKKSSKNTAHYDMRFRGQRICGISIDREGKVHLHFRKSDIKHNGDYFNVKTKFDEGKKVPISDKRVNSFFDELRKVPHTTSQNKDTKSREHKLESLTLKNIAEKDGLFKIENLHFMQPIKFGHGFFQMPTPFKASLHKPEISIRKDGAITGGGIDILARVSKPGPGWRLAVIELKDENTIKEPVHKVMEQALIYATFLAHLLTDEKCGELWYNIFREQDDPKSLPKTFDILVMSMMPAKKQGEETHISEVIELKVGEKKIKLILCTCYLEVDDKFTKIENATGTFVEHKKQPKKK